MSTIGPVHARDLLHLADEMRVDVPIGAVVPRDVVRADRMADEVVLHLAAAVDEDGRWVLARGTALLPGFEVLHARQFSTLGAARQLWPVG